LNPAVELLLNIRCVAHLYRSKRSNKAE